MSPRRIFSIGWTVAELAIIQAHYAAMPRPQLLELLPGRTWRAVQLQASKLRIDRNGTWQPAEDAVLRAHYATASREDLLAQLPGRTWGALCERGASLGISRMNAWRKEELALLRTHYAACGPAGLSAMLARTRQAIQRQAIKMGLKRVWTPRQPRSRAFIGPRPPKPPKPERVAKPKAESKPKAIKPPKPARLLAVKRSAGTPILNAAKEARRQSEEKPRRAAAITADEVRKLPYHHGGRMAYMLNGVAGWQQWQQQQPS